MSAEHAYIAAQRAVFALEKQADTIRLKRVSLETEISVLNEELIALSSELEHRKDAAEAALQAWRMVETARTEEVPQS